MAAPQPASGPLRPAWTAKATLRRFAVHADKAGSLYERLFGKLPADGGGTGPGPDGYVGLEATKPRGRGRSYEFYATSSKRREVKTLAPTLSGRGGAGRGGRAKPRSP